MPLWTHRLATGAFFFIMGLCFASWASRIPSFQQALGISEAGLGAVLLALPAGLMASLPAAAWLVSKLGSRIVTGLTAVLYSLALLGLGFCQQVYQLVICLFSFGFIGNILNIAVNTQAVSVEALYKRTIMASFHGYWSLAGFIGAAIGTFMIGQGIDPLHHYFYITGFLLLLVAVLYRFTLPEDTADQEDKPIFARPDRSLLKLGIIAFFAAICEGSMFDWSGIYFKKVVLAEREWVGAGYTAFMCTMAAGRFMADGFTRRFGMQRTLQVSSALITVGLLIAVLFPDLYAAIAGFFLVGFGVSSVVPLIFSAAARSKVMKPGVAIAAVSTLGLFGFLIGAPLVGLIAGLSSLRFSFAMLALMGFMVGLISTLIKRW